MPTTFLDKLLLPVVAIGVVAGAIFLLWEDPAPVKGSMKVPPSGEELAPTATRMPRIARAGARVVPAPLSSADLGRSASARISQLDGCTMRLPKVTAEAELHVVLEPGATLAGEVTGPRGQPIQGARVSIREPSGPRLAETNETGFFEIDGLVPGRHRLRIDGEGFAIHEQWVEIRETGEERLRIELAWSATLTGRIVDENGRGVPGAIVSAIGSRCRPSMKAEGDGRFQFDRIAEEPLKLFVSAPGHAARTVEGVQVIDSPVEVVLPSSGPQIGQVRDQRTGLPVSFARVTLRRDRRSSWTKTDSEGRFRTTHLAPGEFEIEVRAEGYVRYRREGLSLPSIHVLELELERGATISGRVLGPEWHPLEKAGVLAFRAGPELEPPRSFDRPARRQAIGVWARPDGHFELAGVPDGEYWVLGTHSELRAEPAERVLVHDGFSGPTLQLRMEHGRDRKAMSGSSD